VFAQFQKVMEGHARRLQGLEAQQPILSATQNSIVDLQARLGKVYEQLATKQELREMSLAIR
jgi:hypothetical protein